MVLSTKQPQAIIEVNDIGVYERTYAWENYVIVYRNHGFDQMCHSNQIAILVEIQQVLWRKIWKCRPFYLGLGVLNGIGQTLRSLQWITVRYEIMPSVYIIYWVTHIR